MPQILFELCRISRTYKYITTKSRCKMFKMLPYIPEVVRCVITLHTYKVDGHRLLDLSDIATGNIVVECCQVSDTKRVRTWQMVKDHG